MSLEIVPVTLEEAKRFVKDHHRHLDPGPGHKFSIGLAKAGVLVGVAMVGRPVAEGLQDGFTLEVNRCAVLEGVQNGCSKLYAAAWRAARAMGYRRIVTYNRIDETGVSLVAAGWRVVHSVKGRSWRGAARPRAAEREKIDKLLWEVTG